MPNYRDWDAFLNQAKPIIDPKGGPLQGTLDTPSFNEREEQQHKFTREYFGEAACQKAYFEEQYGPGGSTLAKGRMTR